MVDEWEDDTTEDEVDEVVEEAPVYKAPTWRSKTPQPETGDTVQVEFVGDGVYSILGYRFSNENRVQSIPSHIANLVIATGKFIKK